MWRTAKSVSNARNLADLDSLLTPASTLVMSRTLIPANGRFSALTSPVADASHLRCVLVAEAKLRLTFRARRHDERYIDMTSEVRDTLVPRIQCVRRVLKRCIPALNEPTSDCLGCLGHVKVWRADKRYLSNITARDDPSTWTIRTTCLRASSKS